MSQKPFHLHGVYTGISRFDEEHKVTLALVQGVDIDKNQLRDNDFRVLCIPPEEGSCFEDSHAMISSLLEMEIIFSTQRGAKADLDDYDFGDVVGRSHPALTKSFASTQLGSGTVTPKPPRDLGSLPVSVVSRFQPAHDYEEGMKDSLLYEAQNFKKIQPIETIPQVGELIEAQPA